MFDHGTLEEDATVTWEALTLPWGSPGYGGPVTSLQRAARLSIRERPVWWSGLVDHLAHRRASIPEVGSSRGKTGGRADGMRDSDDRIVGMKAGNDWHRSRWSEGGQCCKRA